MSGIIAADVMMADLMLTARIVVSAGAIIGMVIGLYLLYCLARKALGIIARIAQ